MPIAARRGCAWPARALRLSLAMAALTSCALPVMAQTPACSAQGIQTETPRDKPNTTRLAQRAHDLPFGTHAVVFGDSTIGRWPMDELDSAVGAPAVHISMGGDKLENTTWLVDQVGAAAARQVRVVVASVGTNNLRQDDDCAFSVKAYALAARLRQKFPHGAIYLIGLYQKGPFGQARKAQVLAANQAFRRAAAAFAITYVDVYTPMARYCLGQDACTLFEPNRVHPSDDGYVVITRALRSAMHG